MKQNTKAAMLIKALLTGAAGIMIQFVLIPKLCAGWSDYLWITLNILLPTAFFISISGKEYKPIWLSASVLLQYILLFVLAAPLSANLGIADGALSDLTYWGQVGLWPIITACVQGAVYKLLTRYKK